MLTLTCCQDHILTENIWFVCSETSYSGDERRCYRCGTNERQKLKIELLSQWKLEAESRNILCNANMWWCWIGLNKCLPLLQTIWRHMKAHPGEKSNKCNQCDFASVWVSILLSIYLTIYLQEIGQSIYINSISINSPICLIFPLNPSNENVSKVYWLREQSALWELIGGQWSRQLSDRACPVYIGSQTPLHRKDPSEQGRLWDRTWFTLFVLVPSPSNVTISSDLSCSKCREWCSRF